MQYSQTKHLLQAAYVGSLVWHVDCESLKTPTCLQETAEPFGHREQHAVSRHPSQNLVHYKTTTGLHETIVCMTGACATRSVTAVVLVGQAMSSSEIDHFFSDRELNGPEAEAHVQNSTEADEYYIATPPPTFGCDGRDWTRIRNDRPALTLHSRDSNRIYNYISTRASKNLEAPLYLGVGAEP